MAARKIEGEASAKYASAVRDFATAESVKIEAELARRTLEAKVVQEEALADKARVDAEKASIDLLSAKLELFQRFRKCGYVPVQMGPNEFKCSGWWARSLNKNWTRFDLSRKMTMTSLPSRRPGFPHDHGRS